MVLSRERKRDYSRWYVEGALRAHGAAQPSRYAQKIVVEEGESRAKVRWVPGRDLLERRGSGLALRNRRRILAQIADAISEHLRLRVMHGDMLPQNIVASGAPLRRQRGRLVRPVKVKVIDYGRAYVMGKNDLPFLDYDTVLAEVIPVLSRNKKDAGELEGYFKRKFAGILKKKGLFGKDRSHTLGDFVWLRGLK